MASLSSNSSIVSTASSHDLAIHTKPNSSFDPSTGTRGVGRFNAGKLNTYLHGLNRRLQEENEYLHEQVRLQQEEIERIKTSNSMADMAEQLGEQLQELQEEIDAHERDKKELEEKLEHEKEDRARDKDRWKERMAEVEKGVSDIVSELEGRLEAANQKVKEYEEREKQQLQEPSMSCINRSFKPRMSIRTPKTPGSFRYDYSWLQNTMGGEHSATRLLDEMGRLQNQLDRANASIDDKLERLEEAGLGVVELMDELEKARAHITKLEEQLKEREIIQSVDIARCPNCANRTDASIRAHIPPSDISRETSSTAKSGSLFNGESSFKSDRENWELIKTQLRTMQAEWDEERLKLMGEKDSLQKTANRLTSEAASAKLEAESAKETRHAVLSEKADLETELIDAKVLIMTLQRDLEAEQRRLESLASDQAQATKERKNILTQLHKKEMDMNLVKTQLEKTKKSFEDKLAVEEDVNRRTEALEMQIAEDQEVMDKLREERSALTNEHMELRRQLKEADKKLDEMRRKHSSVQQAHDSRRYQLEVHSAQIEELRTTLTSRNDELVAVQAEKEHLAAERVEVQNLVDRLQSELNRLQKNAEFLGRDLKAYKKEKGALEQEKLGLEIRYEEQVKRCEAEAKKRLQLEKQDREMRDTVKVLSEQLTEQRGFVKKTTEDMRKHFATNDSEAEALRQKHHAECKGLIVQIHYLKAKFTRESALRDNLGWQKDYLLKLLAQLRSQEEGISAAIASVGFPLPSTKKGKTRKSLRPAILIILFLLRARRASVLWREQRGSQPQLAEALEDVRRRRTPRSQVVR